MDGCSAGPSRPQTVPLPGHQLHREKAQPASASSRRSTRSSTSPLCATFSRTTRGLWKKEGVGYFHFGVVRTGNDRLLILDDAGNLKLIDATANEYREVCAAKVCEGNLVTPAISDGRLYARDDQGVVCVQLAP